MLVCVHVCVCFRTRVPAHAPRCAGGWSEAHLDPDCDGPPPTAGASFTYVEEQGTIYMHGGECGSARVHHTIAGATWALDLCGPRHERRLCWRRIEGKQHSGLGLKRRMNHGAFYFRGCLFVVGGDTKLGRIAPQRGADDQQNCWRADNVMR